MLDMRQLKILNVLINCKYMTIRDLAIIIGVSYKTIQKDINQINQELLNINEQITSKTQYGIFLNIKDSVKFYSFIEEQEKRIKEFDFLDKNFDILLLIDFLNIENKGFLKIDDLADKHFISRTKVSACLADVKRILKKFHLKIEKKQRRGLRLTGNENNLRSLMTDLIYFLDCDDYFNKIYFLVPNYSYLKEKVNEVISKEIKKNNFDITDNVLKSVIINTIVQIKRIQQLNYCEATSVDYTYAKELDEYDIALSILSNFRDCMGIAFSENEVAYLARILNGSRKYSQEHIDILENFIENDLDCLIKEIFDRINLRYNKDFSGDLDLYVSLAMHMKPLLSRIKMNFKVKNPMLDEIVQNFPLACDMALEVLFVFKEKFNVIIDENELSYFAIYFNLALERRVNEISKKRVLVLCSSGGGLSKLLAYRLNSLFSKYIEEIDTCDMNKFEDLNLDYYDYIFSTVPINKCINKPVLLINSILSQEDIKNVTSLVSNEKTQLSLKDLISKDIFFTDISGKTRDHVIYDICEKISRIKNVPENFYDSIIERENLFTTELANYVAFPHPIDYKGKESFVSISILDKPVIWNSKKIQIVILVALASDDFCKLTTFYDDLINFTLNKDKVYEILKKSTYDNLINILNS